MDLDISKLQSLINAKRDNFLMEKIESADNDLAEEEAFIEYREQLILMQEAVLKQAEDNLQLRLENLELKQQIVQMAEAQAAQHIPKVPNALGI